ncbi:S8 family serine peptidase [Alkaliphilus transvaalensis]|uniref:S8 family serine peptidase n=1 Tax=Alkaliphilus transvaalensis TaxID=114628 RepID=UPI00047C5796|nr:S8 family serine peptidase [Alkaliphilus transvaalensis]
MKRRSVKCWVFILALTMVLASFTMGTFANSQKEINVLEVELATLYGEYNFSSSELTTVIVELKEESIVEAKHSGIMQSQSKLGNARHKVTNEVTRNVKDAQIRREYDYLFSGFSLELPSNEIPNLLLVDGIKAVYPNVEYTVTDMGGYILDDEVIGPNMLDSAPHIGSHIAWDAGFTGEGVVVAVIDTGVDYTHPDLAHAFGAYKGWDFVDNDNDPQETLPGDPRGAATDHGTHVAGTVAANGLIKGVAPDATLLAYRVLGPGGSGTTENVVAGIERAVQDGAHIMNLSLGNTINSPDWATSIALDWAMAEGVVAITSNGNSGPANWTVGSPGTSRRAISVGATALPYNVYTTSIFTSDGVQYPSAKVMGFPSDEEILGLNGNTYEFVHVGLGYPEDFEGKDLNGKIALISRGDFAFVDKATNAKNAGAVGAIIYNNVAGEHADVQGMAVPTIKTTLADGQKLLAELEAGNNQVTFNIEFASRVGETVADFSSRGPVVGTWMIKPDVSAPGVSINSTIRDGQYGSKQGTSMAAPHVAGAAALILQANPHWGVEEVKAALMNTAENLINPATGQVYPHNTQGAGSIRVMEAINAKTLVTPGSHSFGVFSKTKGKQTERQSFTIKNLSNERKTYSFDVNFVGNPSGIKVMTSNNLRVNGNSSQRINFNVQVDDSKLQPGYYEGTIKVSDGIETVEVPTILFVQEPDYPRITHFSFDENPAGGYNLTTYLPNGADLLEFWMYEYPGAVGNYIGDVGHYTNVGIGYSTFNWNGTIDGNQVASGEYAIFVYAEKAGTATTRGYIVEVK